ncbi:hypothetical protein H5410_003465 [Solanum commersonii]|uniref:Uncharacterized protein n=1 Tax=Solanum commersonii TaxID=4109 RepID=A0A9J6B581_SOLCO|nr:hypothetical protein H5410_003465 [Solanum commersonii]
MEWEECFKNIKQSILPRTVSDHNPVLLECGNWEHRQSYFKFENWWLKVDGFKEMVQGWWSGFWVEGCLDYRLSNKQKMLKQKRKNSLLEESSELDKIQEERELFEDEVLIIATILVELEVLAKQEEVSWRQKSRALWLKQGDNNTNFFQRVATAHRRYNTIDKLLVREPESWRPSFEFRGCSTVSAEENKWLQRPFTEEEVLQTIKQCDGDKAPGNKEKKGYNLVKWETLILSRKQGGLGMRILSIQNNCLLQKWLWRFCTEDGALWRRFIAGQYGLFSQWTTEEDFWNEISKGDNSLRNLFPNLYTLSLQRSATVARVWNQQGWNLVFRRDLND